MTKTAIVLFNLGGPDKPESIRPFLKNFFMDKNIVQAPYLVRAMISSLIARRRSKKEAGSAYGFLGGRSPLLDNTRAQADALEKTLREQHPETQWKTFIAMRYWHPMSDEIARSVMKWQPDRIVLLPLYPQFSTTTTGSSLQDWRRASRKTGLSAPTSTICCYPLDEKFISASARHVRECYDRMLRDNPVRKPRILFSAHGLPEKIIAQGDPYQWQCEESANSIAAATGIENLDWTICYQSRVGPLKWIGPSTDESIRQAGRDGVPVVIYPHAFVSDHVETLVEIDMEYAHLAKESGVPAFARAPALGTDPEFIQGLAALVYEGMRGDRRCPTDFSCCCKDYAASIFSNPRI
ncbi:MAG TPA: ferrochelatase [Micavibrio sp.]|jgi:ferrochelatase